MNKTITNLITMAKKAVTKIAAKKSDKPKAPAKSKDNVVAKAEVPKAIRPVVQQTPVTPVAQEAAAAKPDIDQWKKDHIAKNKIWRAYFHFKGGIYRTSDGKLFANPEEFHADGGTTDQVHGL